MSHGRRQRGPIGRISGINRVENAEVINRVRATEAISRSAAITARSASQPRSFAEALERNERGLGRSEPLPFREAERRALPPPTPVKEESLEPPERLPESFLGLLWWKVKGQL